MADTVAKAAEALKLLPEELREHAVAYLIEQAEKFRTLQADIQEGMEDVDAGRVEEWNFADFLRRARAARP